MLPTSPQATFKTSAVGEHETVHIKMKFLSTLASLSLAALSAPLAASSSLPVARENYLSSNIAYRSPSLTLGSSGLSHDIHAIVRRQEADFVRRSEELLDRRGSGTGVVNSPSVGKNETYTGPVSYPYGIASGDPLDSSIILWTHPEPSNAQAQDLPICLTWQISRNAANPTWARREIVKQGTVCTTKDVDWA